MKEKQTIFVVGISTEVGKTIASAIIVEALQADYWKPIQSGDLDNSDTMKVQRLISNPQTKFHQSAYAFSFPASPHLSASMENKVIQLSDIQRPNSENYLVIEGAGGVFVPLNSQQTMLDLISPADKIILVSRNYLGSINHTMLTIEVLKNRGLRVSGIIFNGEENPSTEKWIENYTKLPIVGRISHEKEFNSEVIKKYATYFLPNLKAIL